MILQEEYNLNLASQLSKKHVKVSQYDTGRRLLITLIKNDGSMFKIPLEASASINGLKPDGNGFRYDCSIENNKVVVDMKEQMTVLAGCVKCEILLSKGGERIATANFMLSVEESPLSENTPISSTDIPLLQKAIEASEIVLSVEKTVKGYSESASKSAQSSQKSAESASSASASSSLSAQASAESASSASQSATNAQASAESASTSATTASTKATEAQTSAESAIQTKAEVEQLKKETVEQTKTLTDSAKQEISTVKDATVTEVTELKNSTVSEITSLKDSTIEAVTLLKDNAKAEADRATESSASAKVQAEKAEASADSIANVTSDVDKLKEDTKTNADSIANVTSDVGKLSEMKISKFYASNQGETHITDSDKGLIQDMTIYGKSQQDGAPTPTNPIEIKSVVNPTIEILGSNLFKTNIQFPHTERGITVSKEGDAIRLKGTAISAGNIRLIDPDISVLKVNKPKVRCTFECESAQPLELVFADATANKWKSIVMLKNNESKEFNLVADSIGVFIIFKQGHTYDTLMRIQVYKGSQTPPYQPYTEQLLPLIHTLNAIKVLNGGNCTIDGQQYIADRIIEKDGVFGIERNVKDVVKDALETLTVLDISSEKTNRFSFRLNHSYKNSISPCLCNMLSYKDIWDLDEEGVYVDSDSIVLRINKATSGEDEQSARNWINSNIGNFKVYANLNEPAFEPLSEEEQTKLKALITNYPITNISITSNQLDGYTVFNYPISLANGWNYVKQKLNDNRDYIYDMDLQSAEAYVNSEYAVTLTELEV